jgi:choline dehydrogenase-like flavoprotein
MRNHPAVSLRFRPKAGYHLDSDAPRNQVGLRFNALESGPRNDIQVQPITSGPLGREAEEIRVGCRLELPLGVGRLTLDSDDPQRQPRLDYQFLEDPSDRERLRAGVRWCADLLAGEAFRGIIESRISPGPADLADDATLDAWLQDSVSIAGHTCGTCKMGPDSDPTAVVDQYLRVKGVEGLRVADNSVIPYVTRANTNATAIMIGEKLSDWIKAGV